MDRETIVIDVADLMSFPSTFGLPIDEYCCPKGFFNKLIESFSKIIF